MALQRNVLKTIAKAPVAIAKSAPVAVEDEEETEDLPTAANDLEPAEGVPVVIEEVDGEAEDEAPVPAAKAPTPTKVKAVAPKKVDAEPTAEVKKSPKLGGSKAVMEFASKKALELPRDGERITREALKDAIYERLIHVDKNNEDPRSNAAKLRLVAAGDESRLPKTVVTGLFDFFVDTLFGDLSEEVPDGSVEQFLQKGGLLRNFQCQLRNGVNFTHKTDVNGVKSNPREPGVYHRVSGRRVLFLSSRVIEGTSERGSLNKGKFVPEK